jgi:hypothetical protein
MQAFLQTPRHRLMNRPVLDSPLEFRKLPFLLNSTYEIEDTNYWVQCTPQTLPLVLCNDESIVVRHGPSVSICRHVLYINAGLRSFRGIIR